METLKTERLTLRPVTPADAYAITHHIGNINVSRMLARIPNPYGLADCQEWITRVQRLNAAGADLIYAVVADELIGVVSINQLDAMPVFAYWLAQSQWGKGFATEACQAALRNAFKSHQINELKSSVFIDNDVSLRLQKKLGFEVTGTGRTFCLSRNMDVDTIETKLSRAAFEEAAKRRTS